MPNKTQIAFAKNADFDFGVCGARNAHKPSDLASRLSYDPKTGHLSWQRPPSGISGRSLSIWNSRFHGREAFTATVTRGYKQGRIDGVAYLAHRVAWAICKGEWPSGVIDHINGDTSDNRIENLRDVSQSENIEASLLARRAR